MIRKLFAGASALVVTSCALSAASASNLAVKDASSVTQYLCEKTASDGSLIACHALLDTTGTQIDPATKQGQTAIVTALGSPLQAGGNVVVTGQLPGFAATPTVNVGTLPAITGTVGISGTLPAFASPPTVNVAGTVPVSGTVSLSGTSGINNAQIGGAAIATGTGASNTGTQRVAVSSDSIFNIGNPTSSYGGVAGLNVYVVNAAAFPAGSGGGTGSNASVGPNASTAPTSSTELGYIGASGNLIGVTGDNAGHPAVSIFGTPTVAISGTVPVSGTVTANLGTLNGAATAAAQASLLAATQALLQPGGTVVAQQQDVQASGTIASATASAAYTLTPGNGQSSGLVGFSGLTASAANLTPESYDGINWVTSPVFAVGSKVPLSTLVADGQYRFSVNARRGFRFRVSTVGTGAINVTSNLSVATFDPPAPTLDVNGNPTVNLNGGPVTDTNSGAFAGEVAMTVGTTYAVGRSLKVNCTAAGNISVTYPDGSTGIWTVVAGIQTLPIAVTAVNSSGTTATATYSNLK